MSVPIGLNESVLYLSLLGYCLYALGWTNQRTQRGLYRFLLMLTGTQQVAALILFLLYLPGILLHEGTHWLAAWLLRLKPNAFTVWPTLRGNTLELGSVQMTETDIWRDTAVGLAPLVVGSTAMAVIGTQILYATELAELALGLRFGRIVDWFREMLAVQDSMLWLYLLFAFGNGMMPSVSDRRSLRLVVFYFGIGVLMLVLADLLSRQVSIDWLLAALASTAAPSRMLVSCLMLVLLFDFCLLGLLSVYDLLLSGRRTQ